mmetsp:Transcript_27598/g.68206  ORF Transcript_27598/g.68206 Transcript_27598/m.68206 type:complete len:167 (-) Transcript_27598:142-642(-)
MSEVDNVVLRHGPWGELIAERQAFWEPTEEEKNGFTTEVDGIICKQLKMQCSISVWQAQGSDYYPKLCPVAVRLGSMAVQSADVERVCKAHKIIHTKARNRLYTTTVHMLLYTYVNLRLLNKCTEELGDFLTQSLEACVDEGEEPLLAGASNTEEPEIIIDSEDDD